ncbi:hypothetical protein [Chryseobacterium indologenes]|uniref:hypothetical protein n=1 Tax=Chryseobacterium indologenes TaxID=253 RepID=UPI000764C349|nr:hypothetical protein [Chryseobacterium indologenes]
MDWQYIRLLLRDYEGGRNRFKNSFSLSNVVKIFGTKTDNEEIKIQLRPFYKELRKAFDENGKEIEGVISDKRFMEIVDTLRNILERYSFMDRFKKS